MQFVIQNEFIQNVAVFHSNINYTAESLKKIIQPKDVLTKMAYEHYWKNIKGTDWVNHIQNQTMPGLQMYGIVSSHKNIDVYNIVQFPEFLYVFYNIYSTDDKSLTLNYFQIPMRQIYAEYSDYKPYTVSLILLNDVNTGATSTFHGETGALVIEYKDDGTPLGSGTVDWQPTDDVSDTTKGDHPWLLPAIILIMAVFLVVVIIIAAAIFIKPARELNYFIHKNMSSNIPASETYTSPVEEEKPIYLD